MELPRGMAIREGRNGERVYYAQFRVKGRYLRKMLSRDFDEATKLLSMLKEAIKPTMMLKAAFEVLDSFSPDDELPQDLIQPGTPEENHIRSKYGLSAEQFNEMLTSQNYRCAICKLRPDSGGRKMIRLVVDHCHKSGTVRGLLCTSCNSSIGKFGDDPDKLFAAIKYLVKGGA